MSRDALIQQALKYTRNRYLLVNLLTQRIHQLKEGAPPLVTPPENASLEEIALQEIAEQKLKFELPTETRSASKN
ncbi:MAG: DNA-directed RNA polymerase subunit omega [Nitrospinota bacterium]|nr:MAG: DNA-directed RNA polymerase subunit omega [Nitrospinota bacterium]